MEAITRCQKDRKFETQELPQLGNIWAFLSNIYLLFFLDKKPVTAEKLRVLNEINKSLDLNEFLQYLLSSPVVSKNPAENCLFFRKTLERHHGRNIGRFYFKMISSHICSLQ